MSTLADQLGPGETASAAYVAHRLAIEAAKDDDGTEQHFARCNGNRSVYQDDLPDPISDASPVHVLAYYGLGTHDLELLERYGCETVGDVRHSLFAGDVTVWRGVAPLTRERIEDAVEMVPRQSVERVGR